MTLDVHELDQILLVGTGVLLLAILAVRLSVGVGLPSLLVYLLMGVALGEAGLGVRFEDAELAHALGFAALVLILAEGGLTTPWPEIRPVMRLGVSLATVGVAVSVAVMAVLAHYVLGLSWQQAVLRGRDHLAHRRRRGVLGAAAGAAAAPADRGARGRVRTQRRADGRARHARQHRRWSTASSASQAIIVWELGVGVLGGLVVGFGGAWLLRRSALPSSGLYPLAVLSFTVLAYAGTAALHGSGFAAVYVAALILGNAELPAPRRHPVVLRRGRLARPDRAVRDARPAGLARRHHLDHRADRRVRGPRADLRSRVRSRWPWPRSRNRCRCASWRFISWAGLRGAVPIVLATIPLAEAVEGADELFDIVFVMVVIYTLVTGPTLPLVAKVLKVARRSEPRDLEVEAAPLERIAADLLQVTISPKSLMHGVEVGELGCRPGRRWR